MIRILEAVYEAGVLRPLEDPGLEEHQCVLLEIRTESQEDGPSASAGWHRVYEGLSEDEIAEIEAIALDRRHFLAPKALMSSSSLIASQIPAGSPPAAARRHRPES